MKHRENGSKDKLFTLAMAAFDLDSVFLSYFLKFFPLYRGTPF
jgi:hypothetical protein